MEYIDLDLEEVVEEHESVRELLFEEEKPAKKKRKKRQQPEFEIQKRIVTYLTELKNTNNILAFYSTINESSRMNSNKAKAQGLIKGAPDMTIILKDGYTLFLELKKDKPVLKSGKPSKVNYQSIEQIEFENSINRVCNKHSDYKCTYGYKETSDLIHKYIQKHKS